MPRRGTTYKRVRFPILAATLALTLVTSGCGLLGSDDSSSPATPTAGGLEKPNLKISVMTTTDLAPFNLAVKNGYFRDAGFSFDPAKDVSVAKSGGDSVAKLTAKEVDIAYSSYTPFFVAKSKGAADIKLVADASSAGPNSCVVIAMPNSKVKNIRDMAGARVA